MYEYVLNNLGQAVKGFIEGHDNCVEMQRLFSLFSDPALKSVTLHAPINQ